MSSINDLINKSKGSKDEITNKQSKPTQILHSMPETNASTISEEKTVVTKQTPAILSGISNRKPKPFKLGIGVAKTPPILTDEKPKSPVLNIKHNNSPLAELKDVLSDDKINADDSISNILGDLSVETPQTSAQHNAENSQTNSIQQKSDSSATLDDLSKFVFAEQPDESTEEITLKFSGMLNSLSASVGTDIPKVLSETLIFMKSHAFLAELLKPEEIGKLVQTMARSYGFVAGNQSEKSVKKKKKAAEQNQILNSLDRLSF